jgi:hypothetical protein
MRFRFLIVFAATAAAGCASMRNDAVPSTQPFEAKVLPPASTRPSNVAVTHADFDRLWAASDAVARSLLFRPALQDRRGGVYQTEPMLSGQWFEPWRRELRSLDAVVQSSLASIRRTITFRIDRNADGTYAVRPEVLIERYSLAERRVTNSAGYGSIFRQRNRRNSSYGTPESDAGVYLPDSYWYPVGNDPDLERHLAEKIRAHLKQ